jgi:hypothetical protein
MWLGAVVDSVVCVGLLVGLAVSIESWLRQPQGRWQFRLSTLLKFTALVGLLCVAPQMGQELRTWLENSGVLWFPERYPFIEFSPGFPTGDREPWYAVGPIAVAAMCALHVSWNAGAWLAQRAWKRAVTRWRMEWEKPHSSPGRFT